MSDSLSAATCCVCLYYQRTQTGPHSWDADCALKQQEFLHAEHCIHYRPDPAGATLRERDSRWRFANED